MDAQQSARLTRASAHLVTGHAVEYDLSFESLTVRDDRIEVWVSPRHLDAWLETAAVDFDEQVLHPITGLGTQRVQFDATLPVGLQVQIHSSLRVEGLPGRHRHLTAVTA